MLRISLDFLSDKKHAAKYDKVFTASMRDDKFFSEFRLKFHVPSGMEASRARKKRCFSVT